MRFLITICAIFYMLLSLGLRVNAHYCGGKLQYIALDSFTKDCNKCGKKNMKGCCKDIQTSFEAGESNSFKTYAFVSNYSIALGEPIFYTFKLIKCILQNSQGIVRANAPPNDSSKPIYLKNSTFII